MPEKNINNIQRPEAPKSGPEASKEKQPEISKRSEVVEGAKVAIESAESAEGAEMVDGNVSEDEGGAKKKASSGLPTGQTGDATVGGDSDDLGVPEVSVMRIQVSTRVQKEIAALEKEAKKIQNSAKFSPFKFTKVVARIRTLRLLLSELAHATAEKVKTLWMNYVR